MKMMTVTRRRRRVGHWPIFLRNMTTTTTQMLTVEKNLTTYLIFSSLLLSFSLSLTLYLSFSLKLSLTLSVSLTLYSSLSSPCFDNFPSCHTAAKMLKNNALCHQEEEGELWELQEVLSVNFGKLKCPGCMKKEKCLSANTRLADWRLSHPRQPPSRPPRCISIRVVMYLDGNAILVRDLFSDQNKSKISRIERNTCVNRIGQSWSDLELKKLPPQLLCDYFVILFASLEVNPHVWES